MGQSDWAGANEDLESAARGILESVADVGHAAVSDCSELSPLGASGVVLELWRPFLVSSS